jgi:hypothetical protein
MDFPADIDALRIPQGTVMRMPARSSPPKPRQPGKFLKGPIPWSWLERAMSLPGKALHVGIQVWHQMGLTRSSEVSISMSGMNRMGVSRFAASRGLAALEKAGLVSVDRHAGRKPVVSILATPPTQGAGLP